MKRFSIQTQSKTRDTQILSYGDVRISIITPYLVRVEKKAKGADFIDDATQAVWYRDFQEVKFTSKSEGRIVEIRTEKVTFLVDIILGKLSKAILSDGSTVTDFNRGNLKGTARTLDRKGGSLPLCNGIMSKKGVTVMDDSLSLVLKDEKIQPRIKRKDFYYFAYGDNYRKCLEDFYKLTGATPLIPKYALGNWWSRYKAYTQEEYVTLMQRFIDKKIPVTVATIDMDWHWVDVIDRFGKEAKPIPSNNWWDKYIYSVFLPGWTGYSWNSELFPDYKGFLKWLKDNGFHTTLNVHPSQGVRFFETQYHEMCKAVGANPKEKKQIMFDMTDSKFVPAYFDVLHHPYEAEGVDFWWLDWQQGTNTEIKGLDPLWALNHYHSLDKTVDGKRRIILSRYAGVGSHRYPVGFSGDTMIKWSALKFQPYFTSTAANVGYTWWSHDIGGHMFAGKDDELYLRWLQFGVFSPINRLHSTSNEFMGKEPWKCCKEVEELSYRYLKLRHRLIPYMYTMNYLTHTEGLPICEPMYYEDKKPQAYKAKNQYRFGTQLIVAPITNKRCPNTLLSYSDVWLPKGRYTDIFTNGVYNGGEYRMFRDLDSIPVLAKQGAIIPMYLNDDTNDLSLSQPHEILVYRGNGSFNMYEDDGESMSYADGAFATTLFESEIKDKVLYFKINKPVDAKGILPAQRKWVVSFKDIVSATVTVNGETIAIDEQKGFVQVELTTNGEETVIALSNATVLKNPDPRDTIINLVSKYQANNTFKSRKFGCLVNNISAKVKCCKCYRQPIEEIQKQNREQIQRQSKE